MARAAVAGCAAASCGPISGRSLAAHAELAGKLVPVVRSWRDPRRQAGAAPDALGEGRPGPALAHAGGDAVHDLLPLVRGHDGVQADVGTDDDAVLEQGQEDQDPRAIARAEHLLGEEGLAGALA